MPGSFPESRPSGGCRHRDVDRRHISVESTDHLAHAISDGRPGSSIGRQHAHRDVHPIRLSLGLDGDDAVFAQRRPDLRRIPCLQAILARGSRDTDLIERVGLGRIDAHHRYAMPFGADRSHLEQRIVDTFAAGHHCQIDVTSEWTLDADRHAAARSAGVFVGTRLDVVTGCGQPIAEQQCLSWLGLDKQKFHVVIPSAPTYRG